MTAGNDGARPPEDDDPFGYLYADGQNSGATPPSGYGHPGARSSYQRVRPVGDRPYGQQGAGRGGYGYPPQQGRPPRQGGASQQGDTAAFERVPSQGYDQPNAHYQAPETLPGGRSRRQGPPPRLDGGGGRGRGPNTKGLLIGAIAVVAAVVVGIGVAMLSGGDEEKDRQAAQDPDTGHSAGPSPTVATEESEPPVELPKVDAKALKLDGGAHVASDVAGAKADGGVYVAGMEKPGASATWTVNGVPEAGKYTLDIAYGVPGKDAEVTLTVNGKPQTSPLVLKNWANAEEGDWEKGWTSSYTYVVLTKGTNTLQISCQQGNQCAVNLDQVWLEKGWKKSESD